MNILVVLHRILRTLLVKIRGDRVLGYLYPMGNSALLSQTLFLRFLLRIRHVSFITAQVSGGGRTPALSVKANGQIFVAAIETARLACRSPRPSAVQIGVLISTEIACCVVLNSDMLVQFSRQMRDTDCPRVDT